MLLLEVDSARVVKGIVEALVDLVPEALFDFSPDGGLSLWALDSSHSAVVEVKLDTTMFKQYKCDRPISLGLSIGDLAKMTKCVDDSEGCALRYDDINESLATVSFSFSNANLVQKQFDLKLMDLDVESLAKPELHPSCTIELSSSGFQKMCRNVNEFAKTLSIVITEDPLLLT